MLDRYYLDVVPAQSVQYHVLIDNQFPAASQTARPADLRKTRQVPHRTHDTVRYPGGGFIALGGNIGKNIGHIR